MGQGLTCTPDPQELGKMCRPRPQAPVSEGAQRPLGAHPDGVLIDSFLHIDIVL